MKVTLTQQQVTQAWRWGQQLFDALSERGRGVYTDDLSKRLWVCQRHELICQALSDVIGFRYGGPFEGFASGQRDVATFEVKGISRRGLNLCVPSHETIPLSTPIVLGFIDPEAHSLDVELCGWALAAEVCQSKWRRHDLPNEPWIYPRRKLGDIQQLKAI